MENNYENYKGFRVERPPQKGEPYGILDADGNAVSWLKENPYTRDSARAAITAFQAMRTRTLIDNPEYLYFRYCGWWGYGIVLQPNVVRILTANHSTRMIGVEHKVPDADILTLEQIEAMEDNARKARQERKHATV